MWHLVCDCGVHVQAENYFAARRLGEDHVMASRHPRCLVYRVGDESYYLMHSWGTSRHTIRERVSRALARAMRPAA